MAGATRLGHSSVREGIRAAVPKRVTAELIRNPTKENGMKGIVALAALSLVLVGAAEASKKAPDKKPVIYTLGLTGAK